MQSLIQDIEDLKTQTESLTPQQWQTGLERLSPARLAFSGSLRSGKSESWIAANTYASEKIAQDTPPSAQDIFHLNALLRSLPTAPLRTGDVFLGPHKAIDAEKLPAAFQYFCDEILPQSKHKHSLLGAALTRFWLVSLHPFEDANGRTSVILADWLLLLSGYLPLGFNEASEGLIASFNQHRPSATAANAVLKTLRSVRTSYRLILDLNPHL
ncbi:Fic family protein [Bdellovibrio sp. HCB2-146]|uniref:Fic family protein n=1 Tax=Bdellovibrio sp. HCB2-146 TaxID=3394362 RepID=UPI0039BC9BA3